MSYYIIRLVVFICFFALAFYAFTAVQFEKFCKVHEPVRIYILLFLLCLITAYLATQAVLELTLFNGLRF